MGCKEKICLFDGCFKKVRCKDLCNTHYEQHRTGKKIKPAIKHKREQKHIDNILHQKCTKCDFWKELNNTNFSWQNKHYKYKAYCKLCTSKAKKNYKPSKTNCQNKIRKYFKEHLELQNTLLKWDKYHEMSNL